MLIIGLMSGTSLDGVDASLVKVDENKTPKFKELDNLFIPYSNELKNKVLAASNKNSSNVQLICSLNVELGYIYLEATKKILEKNNLKQSDITFVTMHGQTIWHNPNNMDGFYSSTLQIGDPSIIAYNLNVLVISNFRMMDMAAGGTGAPLVPFVNYVLYHSDKENIALQNIGGIGNVCYLKANGSVKDVIAFDTGPGNMLIDMAMTKLYNMPFDEDGQTALKGNINKEVLDILMNDEYIKKPLPKSTGREHYNEAFLNKILTLMKSAKKEDIIATITAYTAYSIAYAYEKFCPNVDKIVLSGGGAKNKMIVELLKNITKKDILIHEISDSYEAFCFAILGFYTYNFLPSNVKSVTGAKDEVILGQFTYPPRKKEL